MSPGRQEPGRPPKLVFGNIKKAGRRLPGHFEAAGRAVGRWSRTPRPTPSSSGARIRPAACTRWPSVWLAKLKAAHGERVDHGARELPGRRGQPGRDARSASPAARPVRRLRRRPRRHEVAVGGRAATTRPSRSSRWRPSRACPLTRCRPGPRRRLEVPTPEPSARRCSGAPRRGGLPEEAGRRRITTLSRTTAVVEIVAVGGDAGFSRGRGRQIRAGRSRRQQAARSVPDAIRATIRNRMNTLCGSHRASGPAAHGCSRQEQRRQQDSIRATAIETLQWVFVGVGGASLALRGRLFTLQGLPGRRQREHQQVRHNHGLRLFPTASASAAGVVAASSIFKGVLRFKISGTDCV